MRAPAFWWQPGRGALLAPFAAAYGAVAAWRMRTRGEAAGIPVICLGNLTVGGGGKTPAALAVARLLLDAGQQPFFLSRGYGGRLAGPIKVDRTAHISADVGDEPLLLARIAPTVIARDRVAGARLARSGGASAIVMDDGFQNPSLAKDLSILVVDGRRGIGNGRIVPAGPLRAPFESQLARAQALVVVGPRDGAAIVTAAARRHGLALFHGHIEPDQDQLAALRGQQILAFAGIADPEKFFATLSEAGITVARRTSFADHHQFTAGEARELLAQAQAQNLTLLTTEKDHVRLAGDPHLAALAGATKVLPVRLVIDEQDAFRAMVLKAAKQS